MKAGILGNIWCAVGKNVAVYRVIYFLRARRFEGGNLLAIVVARAVADRAHFCGVLLVVTECWKLLLKGVSHCEGPTDSGRDDNFRIRLILAQHII